MLEEVKQQIADAKRVLIAVPNTGEVERIGRHFSANMRFLSGWAVGLEAAKAMLMRLRIFRAKFLLPP